MGLSGKATPYIILVAEGRIKTFWDRFFHDHTSWGRSNRALANIFTVFLLLRFNKFRKERNEAKEAEAKRLRDIGRMQKYMDRWVANGKSFD